MFPEYRCALSPHRNAGRLHWGKAESIQLCDSRVGQATTGAEAHSVYDSHDATSPSSFPHPPSDFCPISILTRVWECHHGKIVELKMFVGWF